MRRNLKLTFDSVNTVRMLKLVEIFHDFHLVFRLFRLQELDDRVLSEEPFQQVNDEESTVRRGISLLSYEFHRSFIVEGFNVKLRPRLLIATSTNKRLILIPKSKTSLKRTMVSLISSEFQTTRKCL